MAQTNGDIGEAVGTVVGFTGGALIAAWGLWCTIVAFVGGPLPIPLVSWESPGGFWIGLLFLFVITPVATAIGSQLFVWIIGFPLALLIAAAKGSQS